MKHIRILLLVLGFFPALRAREIQTHTPDGYQIPVPGTVFTFPRGHGSHPGFRIEWWYVTGHLLDDQGERHGFQLTFFRSALRPLAEQEGETAPFGRDQLHMAHAAWSEIVPQRFVSEERLARGGWDAGASTQRLDLFQNEWRLAARDDSANPVIDAFFTLQNSHRVLLSLRPLKPFVQFGEDGVERKGTAPSAASHYLTFTRLQAEGMVEIDGESRRVTGLAWMDHEISSSQLDENQSGWDWASIHLDDGREIMMYILRREDGTVDPHSVLYWVDREGGLTAVTPDAFTWKANREWTSPKTGATYPLDWTLTVNDPESGAPATFRVQPWFDTQEHSGRLSGIPYWEGACRVTRNGQPAGLAYVELTGYAEDTVEALR